MDTLFFRLLNHEDKAAALADAIGAVREGREANTVVHAVDLASFRQVPGSPFAYWVSERVRRLFTELPPFEVEGRWARLGAHGSNDFRYVRCWWEVDCTQPHGLGEWRTFAKGGMFSPFYADIHLVVDWEPRRSTFHGFFGRPGREIERPESVGFFFRPGLTWPRRTNGLSFRVLPTSCIFADKGPAAFVEHDLEIELLALCAILNSQPFGYLISLQLARTQLAQSYEVGLIQQTPVPDLSSETTQRLAALACCVWSMKHSLDTASETSHAFILPALLQVVGESLTERALAWTEKVRASNAKLAHIQAEIDEHTFNLYGIHDPDQEAMLEISNDKDNVGAETDDDADDDEEVTQCDASELVAQLLSYGVGLVFKRFDLDLALGRRPLPPEPEPFAPLPSYSPGMAQEERLDINIYVDDPGNAFDLAATVRERLEAIQLSQGGTAAADSWLEQAGILLESDLANWLRRDFFAFHLKNYSKSRRKAPIYWPLHAPSGSYTLWLYYHHLNDQTLYTCVNDFVEPKLRQVAEQLHALRTKSSRSKQEDKELERLLDFEQELKDFRDELLRVAKFWKPNLNDGVQITAAPLWKLFQHKPWRKTLKETWDRLENGDYDWAHLAYSIWPDRVREKCKHDKSLAIPHGLEDLYEAPPEQPRKKRGRTRG